MKRLKRVTLGAVAAGVGGALIGAFTGSILSGITTGALLWEGVGAVPEALVTTAFWAGPVIIVVGVPVAVVIEVGMRGRPPMRVQLVVYGLTGAGLGLGYMAGLGALMPDGTLRSLSLPIVVGALAAIGGKVGAELYVRRGSGKGIVVVE